jgi:hypothetical protein
MPPWLAYLRKFFGWCAERDAISEVPTYRIRLNGSLKARERALNLDELRAVWAAVDTVGGTGGALVKMLILTAYWTWKLQMRANSSVMSNTTDNASIQAGIEKL